MSEFFTLVLHCSIAGVCGALASLIVYCSWNRIAEGLTSAKILSGMGTMLAGLTFSLALLIGVGPLSRTYGASMSGEGYRFPHIPVSAKEWIGSLYNTAYSITVGVYPLIVVMLFTVLVLQVGVTRARLSSHS